MRYRLWVKACSDTFDEQVCQLWICEALTALCCQLLDSPAKTGKQMRQDMQNLGAAFMLSASSLPDVKFLATGT